jgi:hypothetical protein
MKAVIQTIDEFIKSRTKGAKDKFKRRHKPSPPVNLGEKITASLGQQIKELETLQERNRRLDKLLSEQDKE